MKIRYLEIKNFRGIKDFSQKFGRDFVCLIGRGDSCKTSILEAVSYALSPSWNITFHDTDFHKNNFDAPIEISVSLTDFPEEFLSDHKYGLHIRGLDKNGDVIDSLEDDHEKVITIKLKVDKYLEPQWSVTNNRNGDKTISASDRTKLNCFMVSDYVDRHFSWNRGNPLYSILKLDDKSSGKKDKDIVIDAVREAKKHVDNNNEFAALSKAANRVVDKAATLGLDLSDTQTTIDFRDIFVKDSRVCLHDEKNIPFRLKGKGSKRLASIAVQLVLAQDGGIVLIDEIEQGLEPDRARHLARYLKDDNKGQILITTHSREVVTELKSDDLLILHRNKTSDEIKTSYFDGDDEKLQACVRACPEAFFAKKIIVGEGATEVGVCRALDQHRKKQNQKLMSFQDCAYIDGHGDDLFEKTEKLLEKNLFKVSVLCDSDKKDKAAIIQAKKEALTKNGAKIFDCEKGNAIEQQVFKDLPWDGVKELINYILRVRYDSDEDAMKTSIQSKYKGNFPENWKEADSTEMRTALAATSLSGKKDRKEWFKRIDRGEFLGEIIFKYFDQIKDENNQNKHLREMLLNLSKWIDE